MDQYGPSARARMLYRLLLREADDLGYVPFEQALRLTVRLNSQYGSSHMNELVGHGLVEPWRNGWIVPLKEIASRAG